LPPKKTRTTFLKPVNTRVFFISILLTAALVSNCLAMSSKGTANQPLKAASAQAVEPTVQESSLPAAGELGLVDTVCKLVYQNHFDEAGTLIKDSAYQNYPSIRALSQITEQYHQMQQRRQAERTKTYKKELAELKEIENPTQNKDSNSIEIKDVNEANDVNDITKTLSVIAQTAEYATAEQKNELLNKPFVIQTFRRAMDKAADYESKGKWIDAYLICYSWLVAIDANNKNYSDYAEQLLDKTNIVESFMNSPCETSSQRYEGVSKKAFLNAIDILETNYVSRIIDYQQMLSKALTRCKLLSLVLSQSKDQILRNISKSKDPNSRSTLAIPDTNELAVWSKNLDQIQGQLSKWPLGIDKDKFVETFEEVLKANSETAKIPETILISQFSDAALSALDPYTVMVWPQETKEFERLMTNEFSGIGVEISKQKGMLTVNSLLPDTPAYEAGLDAGDVIEAVDGVAAKDMPLTCAVKNITGPAGTKVKLTIKHPGEEKPEEITITRATIVVPTIYGWQRTLEGKWRYMIDEENKIGYVQITSFSEKTADDLEKALKTLEADGMKGLILDLRFNSGGLLNSATDVADKFISKGLIVSTRPRHLFWTYISATREGTHPDYPLVILINSGSASASEIVAGALADKAHNRAILVGERTHGKGSVQQISARPGSNAKLKFTMAYYHLPSGQRVESQEEMKKQGRKDWGVAPQIEVKMGSGVLAASEELRKMLDVRRENDILVRSGHKITGTENKHSVEETLESDPQLATALLVVKTKLIDEQNARVLASLPQRIQPTDQKQQ
jgi:carboxyl-terminal processing protease